MSGDPRRGRSWRQADEAVSADPYATLGLPAGAPIGEVKRAYRRLAKAFHPDSAGAEALPRFLAIHEAYERITTGRVLPGATRAGGSPPEPAPPREPWRADPARARATRRGAAAGATAGRGRTGARGPTADDGSTGGPAPSGKAPGGAASGGRTRAGAAGRRGSTRKATMGSTSYDEARDRVDASWSGASWYGPTSGEYWIINPREYADPRKHGPAYQARIRQEAAEAAAAGANAVEPDAEVAPGTPAAPDTPGTPGTEAASAPDSAAPPAGVGATPTRSGSQARRPPPARPTAPPPGRAIHPAPPPASTRAPGGETEAGHEEPAWARWLPLGGAADDPLRRLRLALVAWPPLGIAAAIAAADVTGCGVYAASCTGVAPLLPWLAQVAILALLMLLPPLARLLAVGTVGVLLALVPATAVLLAVGAAGAPQAGFALGALLALAWLAGVGYAAASAARRASLSSPG